MLEHRHKAVLDQALDVYGSHNQIMVSIEELGELITVLAKYQRYDTEQEAVNALFDSVLDEVADVEAVIHHIKSIFGIGQRHIAPRLDGKMQRLHRWLENDSSGSMKETLIDRKV